MVFIAIKQHLPWPWQHCINIHHPNMYLPQCKCMLCCGSNLPHIDLQSKELERHHSNTSPTIHFNDYHLISSCTVHVRFTLDENKICRLCLHDPTSVPPEKIYTRKKLIMMEKYIDDFHTNLYMKEIQSYNLISHMYKFYGKSLWKHTP